MNYALEGEKERERDRERGAFRFLLNIYDGAF